jgi:hypothetical protein
MTYLYLLCLSMSYTDFADYSVNKNTTEHPLSIKTYFCLFLRFEQNAIQ